MGPEGQREEPSELLTGVTTTLFTIMSPIVKNDQWASLVAQWLRVCLPTQGTWVRGLVWEDPTCRGATGPVSHSY